MTTVPDWLVIAAGIFVAWFVIDMSARIYLMYHPGEDYKEDRTADPDKSYRHEKEAEAIKILSQYRVGRWLLEQRDK